MASDGDEPELSRAMPYVINQNAAYVRKCSAKAHGALLRFMLGSVNPGSGG